ncbi:hypothetical protein [Streptomyces sp. MZ04]|uniref:hypothetical protein n=1 Tax=Streptomyces sp. MZ04 TaxID=2559236 RepID=UPI00107EDFFB|nr:hypothetical protein [Streptomyces sp. MZ04]TGB07388.1 hypothetical protein E2651_21775 [Streptomyces sp. MZ04]
MTDTPFEPDRSRTRRAPAAHAPTATGRGHRRVGADEKLIRRMLAKVGARPVGHADPLPDDAQPADSNGGAPQAPVAAAPGWPPADARPTPRQPAANTASRLPDWRLTDKPELTVPNEQDEPEHEQEAEQRDDEVQEEPVPDHPRLRDRVRTWAGNAAHHAGSASTREPPGDEAPVDGDEFEENGDEPDSTATASGAPVDHRSLPPASRRSSGQRRTAAR